VTGGGGGEVRKNRCPPVQENEGKQWETDDGPTTSPYSRRQPKPRTKVHDRRPPPPLFTKSVQGQQRPSLFPTADDRSAADDLLFFSSNRSSNQPKYYSFRRPPNFLTAIDLVVRQPHPGQILSNNYAQELEKESALAIPEKRRAPPFQAQVQELPEFFKIQLLLDNRTRFCPSRQEFLFPANGLGLPRPFPLEWAGRRRKRLCRVWKRPLMLVTIPGGARPMKKKNDSASNHIRLPRGAECSRTHRSAR